MLELIKIRNRGLASSDDPHSVLSDILTTTQVTGINSVKLVSAAVVDEFLKDGEKF